MPRKPSTGWRDCTCSQHCNILASEEILYLGLDCLAPLLKHRCAQILNHSKKCSFPVERARELWTSLHPFQLSSSGFKYLFGTITQSIRSLRERKFFFFPARTKQNSSHFKSSVGPRKMEPLTPFTRQDISRFGSL